MTRSPLSLRWSRASLGMLLLTLATLGAFAASPKRVLFIHSFGRGFEPYHTVAGRLRTELASQMAEPIDFFEASLESARFTSLDQESPLLEYLRAQFAGHHLDLVVPVGGPAAQFVQRHRQQLFPETPMLAAVDQRLFDPSNLKTNDATALTANEPGLTVEMLLQVLPKTTNVVVVMGNSAIERFWSAQVRRELQPYTNGVSFVWLDQLPFSEMLRQCSALPPRSAIFFPLLFIDAAGVPHLEAHAMLRLHEAANAPIFGIWINQLGQGILGGRLMDIEEYSRKAANAAARILRGESPGSVKIPPQRVGPPEFDWRELRRWGISEARLPGGSVVRFRQPGIWERYWWLVCGGILFCAVEAALIVGLLVNRAKRHHGERMATLIAELSSRFVNLPTDKLDAEIEAAQRRICEGMGLDLSALWQWTDGSPRYFAMTHLYRPLGGPPTPARFDAQEAFPWCLKGLLAGKIIPVSSMEALPPEAGRDRESWLHFGIKSNLTVPLLIEGGQLIGGLSFNTVRKARSWPKELVARLELVAQIFGNALARKNAELTLRASEELNRATFEQAAVGIAHVGTDGRWLRTNDKLCAIVGYPREELLKMTFQDITHPDDLETDLVYVRQVLSGEIKTYSMEKRYFRKDRSLVWVNLTVSLVRTMAGEPKHFISVVEDISERKRAEARARESEARLSLAADAAGAGLWRLDLTTRCFWVTTKTRELFAFGADEVFTFDRFLSMVHPEDQELMRQKLQQVLESKAEVAVEYRVVRRDGQVRWMQSQGRFHGSLAGQPDYLMGVTVDITAQRRAELESQRLRGNLAHLTRVNTLGALSGSLAHELNQPLGIILSNAQAAQELLTQEPPDTAEVQAILTDIVKADRRAGEVIERLRALFKGGQAALQKLSLNAVIEEVLHLTRAELLGRGVTSGCELAADLPLVTGDRVQLQQLVLNLILNAADAMAANAPGTRRLHLRTILHLRHVRVSVRDEGEGLPADVERLFQALYTTKPQGLGMGLAICRSIVAAHDGRLWAERHPERGAVFYFELPVVESVPGVRGQGLGGNGKGSGVGVQGSAGERQGFGVQDSGKKNE